MIFEIVVEKYDDVHSMKCIMFVDPFCSFCFQLLFIFGVKIKFTHALGGSFIIYVSHQSGSTDINHIISCGSKRFFHIKRNENTININVENFSFLKCFEIKNDKIWIYHCIECFIVIVVQQSLLPFNTQKCQCARWMRFILQNNIRCFLYFSSLEKLIKKEFRLAQQTKQSFERSEFILNSNEILIHYINKKVRIIFTFSLGQLIFNFISSEVSFN